MVGQAVRHAGYLVAGRDPRTGRVLGSVAERRGVPEQAVVLSNTGRTSAGRRKGIMMAPPGEIWTGDRITGALVSPSRVEAGEI